MLRQARSGPGQPLYVRLIVPVFEKGDDVRVRVVFDNPACRRMPFRVTSSNSLRPLVRALGPILGVWVM